MCISLRALTLPLSLSHSLSLSLSQDQLRTVKRVTHK